MDAQFDATSAGVFPPPLFTPNALPMHYGYRGHAV